MGNKLGKLFGSTSKSADIQQIPDATKPRVKNTSRLQTNPPTSAPVTSAPVTSTPPSSGTVENSTLASDLPTSAPKTVDKESVSPVIDLPQFLIDYLTEIATREGFKEFSIDVAPGSNHADGFLAVIKRVTLSGVRNGVDDKLLLICKVMPASKARREQFNSDAVFIREAFMYREVLPVFEAFQKEKGLSFEDSFHDYPKCYGTLDDKENDRFVIIMEDLKDIGYQMYDKFKPADFDHVKLFAESLGKFHAVSFALKDQRPEVFARFKSLKDVFVQQCEEKPEMQQMFAYFYDKSIAAFKPEDEAEIKTLTTFKENFSTELARSASGENSEPFSIVNHGDCWNNNIMFRYGKENNVPVNICLIDYQISRYSSPVLDLVYFFFSSTDKALRDAHYTELIQMYYNSLSTHLTKLGSDPNKLFSFDDLQDQLKKFGGPYALIVAPMLLNIITTKPDDIPDMDNFAEDFAANGKSIEEGMKAFHGNDASLDKFNERIRDVVRDILKFGYYQP